MVRDMNLLFDPDSKEYLIITDDGHRLKLSEKDFQAIKNSMNGISYAFQLKSRKMKESGGGE